MEHPREVTGIGTRLVLRVVSSRCGPRGVEELLRCAGERRPAEELEDEDTWSSFAAFARLLEAAHDVLPGREPVPRIGAAALEQQVGGTARAMLRRLGSPELVYRHIAWTGSKVTSVSCVRALEVQRGRARLVSQLRAGIRPSRFYCQFAQGLLATIPQLFGLPPATVAHTACAVDGADGCEYELAWSTRPRWWQRSRSVRQQLQVVREENEILTRQLRDLQTTVADLVRTDRLEKVLATVAQRSASAVRGHRTLLAVESADGGHPSVYADGYAEREARSLATAVLTGQLPAAAGRLQVEIASAQRRYGRLLIENRDGQDFLTGERQQLEAYAQLSAAALDVVSALEEARRRGDTAGALLDLTHSLATADSREQVEAYLADGVLPLADADQASVYRYDTDAGVVRVVAAAGPPVARRAIGQVVSEADTPDLASFLLHPELRVYDVETADPFLQRLMRTQGRARSVVVPLAHDQLVFGAATVSWGPGTRPPTLTADLRRRLEGFADQGSLALRQIALLEQNRHQATHDALTGLPRRTLLEDRVRRSLEGQRRHDEPLALLFIDLDDFKQVNDAHGHGAGDVLLQEAANRIRAQLRPTDTPARMGGDEFAVLLDRVGDVAEAEAVARRLVEAFRTPVAVDGETLPLGVSVGVVVQHDPAQDVAALLRKADLAMYAAKASGKGGYTVYSPRLADHRRAGLAAPVAA